MRRHLCTYIISAFTIISCGPLDYVEPNGMQQDYSRQNDATRSFYHQSMVSPIIVEYQNGTAKGKILYELDDPYVDINMSSAPRTTTAPEGHYSIDEVNDCFNFYITAQKAIIDDDLELANKHINKALEIMEIKPFFDLKGSIYYLSGDTIKANYYWNYLKLE